ncbi:L-alanine exporter AlaE [Pseudoruegeria sp. HB172150]|uniref:L-alanine exporter AlaE n=1 Tax=Pseudoruegeria sp. HB172150 TaxID=2721164 RepID=UPI0015534419|nr:L-alanine exporter AlaE [Pseudoruegeria sp. HB172150]
MRNFIADTLALVIFFTITGVLNERLIAGMDWAEVLRARTIGAPLMVLTARPYGVWRDWMMARRAAESQPLIFDSLALLVFQVPIYAGIVAAGGADAAETARASAGAALMMLAFGRPYGVWLGIVRGWFGLPPDGQKPMSLGG